jgi:hypothetical protein
MTVTEIWRYPVKPMAGEPRVDGRPWDSPEIATRVVDIAGPGGCLRLGAVLVGVQDLRLRCVMTSFDPDTLAQDKGITRGIYERFEGKLALNCFVIEGGAIAVGNEVRLGRDRGCAEAAAGRFDK